MPSLDDVTSLGTTDLEVSFPSKTRDGSKSVMALGGVTMKVEKGTVVGIVGESGSGKTTLARTLVGLQKPSSGRSYCTGIGEGLSGTRLRRERGRRIAMVFQDPRSSLNPRLSIGSVIADPLIVHRVGNRLDREKTVTRLLDDVGLPGSVAERPVRSLSGGQLQRVALARALALQPDFIVADEPTSALDVSVQAQILNLIMDLKAAHGFGMLVISHDMRVMRALTDELLVMLNGNVVERGSTEQIFRSPEAPYTQDLLKATPLLASLQEGRDDA